MADQGENTSPATTPDKDDSIKWNSINDSMTDPEIYSVLKRAVYIIADDAITEFIHNPEISPKNLQTFKALFKDVLDDLKAETVDESFNQRFDQIENRVLDEILPTIFPKDLTPENHFPGISVISEANSKPVDNVAQRADPVNLFDGSFIYSSVDFVLCGAGFDFTFSRTFSNQSFYNGPIGNKWDHSYNLQLRVSEDLKTIFRSTGTLRESVYRKHTIHDYWFSENGESGIITEDLNGYKYKSSNGISFLYEASLSESYNVFLIKTIQDRFGNYLLFNYENGRLNRVEINHPDRVVNFEYNLESRIKEIRDFVGRIWKYDYDDFGDLVAVTSPGTELYKKGLTTCYEYTTSYTTDFLIQHNLITIIDAAGQIYLENEYGSNRNLVNYNKVTRQRQGGGEMLFDYQNVIEDFNFPYEEHQRPTYQTIVTERNGHNTRYLFNYFGNMIYREEYAVINGIPKIIGSHYRYNKDGNLIGLISPLGAISQYLYGRDYYENNIRISENYLAIEDENLDIRTRQSFDKLLSTVTRAKYYDITSLNLSNGLWRDIFPDIYSAADEDIIQKFTYEPEFGQLLTVSDVRFTQSADPDFNEDISYFGHLTKYSYRANHNTLFHSLESIRSPNVTLPNGETTSPTVIELSEIDEKGRILRVSLNEGLIIQNSFNEADTGLLEGFLKKVIIDPGNLSIQTSFERDLLGRITRTFLPKFHESGDERFIVKKEYNKLDQIISAISPSPLNLVIQKQYNRVGNLEKETLQLKKSDGTPQDIPEMITSYVYDQEFNVVRKTIADSKTFLSKRYHYIYNSSGSLFLTIAPGGKKDKLFFNGQSLLSKKVEDHGRIAVTTKKVFDADGRVTKLIDPNGAVSKFKYDALGRIKESEDPLGNRSVFDYDKLGNIVCFRFFERKNESIYLIKSRAEFIYDELGRKIKAGVNEFEGDIEVSGNIDDAFLHQGPGRLLTSLFFYDKNNQLIRLVDQMGREHSRQYDVLGRLANTKDPYENEKVYKYDSAGNLVRSERVEAIHEVNDVGTISGRHFFAANFAYDELDRLVEETNSLGNRTSYSYDSRSFITEITNSLGDKLSYEYDFFGRCSSVTQVLANQSGGIAISNKYQYSIDDLVIAQKDALGRMTGFEYDTMYRITGTILPDGTQDFIMYDKASRVVGYKDRNGLVRLTQRDAVGRPTSVKNETSSLVDGIEIEGSQLANYLYDGLGRLLSAENEYSKLILKYNSLDWLLEENCLYNANDNSTSEGPFKIKREYSDSGALSAINYPSGRRLAYQRDSLDRIVRLEQTLRGNSYPGDINISDTMEIMKVEYEGLRRKKIIRSNETSTEYDYDAGGRLLEIKHMYNQGVLMHMQFLHDSLGNIRKRIELSNEITAGYDYHYDSLHRLDGVSKSSVSNLLDLSLIRPSRERIPDLIPDVQADINILSRSANSPEKTYDYDFVGNRLSIETDAIPINEYEINNLDQLKSTNDGDFLTYDLNGNLIETNTFLYKYNFRNQLSIIINKVSGEKIELFHDYLGRRIKEIKGDNATFFVYDFFNIIEEHNNEELICSNILDAGIDIILLSSSRGNEYWFYNDQVRSIRHKMNGKVKDVFYEYDEFGKEINGSNQDDFNRIRFAGKRIISEINAYDFIYRIYDPSNGRFLQRDPRGFVNGSNLYVYVMNNPLSFTDPFGTESRPETTVNTGINLFRISNAPIDINGSYLEGTYNLWSGDLGKAAAKAAKGWIMGQTPQHAAAKGAFVDALAKEARKLGLPFNNEDDLFRYAGNQVNLPDSVMDQIWGPPSREVARKASLAAMPVASYGLDTLPPGKSPADTVQVKDEIPTVRGWGSASGALMKLSGFMNMWNASEVKNPLIKVLGLFGGGAEIVGGTLYLGGAATMTTKLMSWGSGISRYVGGPTAGLMSGYNFYDDIENGNWGGAIGSGTGTASNVALTLGSKAMAGPLAAISFGWSLGWGGGKWMDAKYHISDTLSDRAIRNKDIYQSDFGLSESAASFWGGAANIPVLSTVGEFLGNAAGWNYVTWSNLLNDGP